VRRRNVEKVVRKKFRMWKKKIAENLDVWSEW
jgi:hypothetical protein